MWKEKATPQGTDSPVFVTNGNCSSQVHSSVWSSGCQPWLHISNTLGAFKENSPCPGPTPNQQIRPSEHEAQHQDCLQLLRICNDQGWEHWFWVDSSNLAKSLNKWTVFNIRYFVPAFIILLSQSEPIMWR